MIFIFENGKVDLIPEAKSLPEIKNLKAIDKTKGKVYFYMWITYLYYVYRQNGLYENLFTLSRKRQVCVDQLKKSGEFYKDIENKKEVKALINWYQENSKTKEERLLESLDSDIEVYLEHLKNIPYEITVKIEEETKGVNGEGGGIQTFSKVEDNSDRKMKAIKNSKELVLYRKELKKLVRETGSKKAGKKFRTRKFEE